MNFSAEAARNGDSIFRKYHHFLIYCMRITLLICFVTTLSLQVVFATAANGQGMANVNVSIELDNEDLISAIKKIENSTNFRFLYKPADVKDINHLNLNLRSVSVEGLMKQLLAGSSLTFKQIDDRILITKNANLTRKQIAASTGSLVVADTIISGTVFDAKTKDRITGATILQKNTKNMVLTDGRGNFRISSSLGSVLLISYIGYETQEVTITQKVLEIRLSESAQSLKGVVVTGIFAQSKSTFTGAARTFNGEELSKVSNNNVLTALKSLDPSFQMPENLNLGSNPNVLPDVVLRGGNTLVDTRQATATADPFNYQSAPNAPLFILDGFETSLQRINDLDMNRIASVTILKDAGATAIYGSRGANGVIVIEQVRPVEGKLRFTYNASTVIEAPDITGYDLLNAQEKFDLEDRSGVFSNTFNTTQNALDLVRSNRLAAVKSGVNTHWISKPLRTGIGQKHNIYAEGGADAVTYGLNLTYDQKSGVMKGSDRTTTTGNSFISYRLKNFQFRNDLTLSFNKANNSPYGSFRQYTQLNPYWNPYDANGDLKVYLEEVIDPQTGLRVGPNLTDYYNNLNGYVGRPVNPLYNASLNIKDQTTYKRISNNFETRWQAKEWLRLTGRLSYTQQSDESDIFLPAQHSSFANITTFEKGSYTKGYGETQRIEGFFTGEANKNFGKHFVSGSATFNVQENSYNNQSFRVVGFSNPNLDELVLGNQYPANTRPAGSESVSRSIGTLARVAYAYDNRYLFDATYRLDGSSLFGSDKRFAPFWSLGAGWNLHNEEFLKDNSAVNELKLRYTIGTTGSQSFESYKGITTSLYYTDRDYRGVIASYLLGYGNSALAWQKTLKNNVGLDFTLFNRFSVTANYFADRTKGSIAFISSAPSSGFPGYYDNMGDVVNKGYEVYARYNLIAKPANRNNWSVFTNLAHVTNKIEKISSTIRALNNRANTSLSATPLPRYAEGQSVNVIWGVQSLGIDPASGNELFRKRDGSITTTYDPADQVIIGDATPKFRGNIGTNLEIDGIGFNIYLAFNVGGDTYNQTLVDRVENVNVNQYNVDRRVAESRWQKPGDVSLYRAIVNYAGTTSPPITYVTSRFVQKNNFIAGESASLYYRFSNQLNKRLGLQNTKVTLFTSDVFRLASIKRERGLDYPFSRSYTIQLQTTF
ncbi:SusC/RagA family TonB-linked outer membrane protein [Pedobacter metabolipauper]|uniref:TonB-linked SusC/RagA family outer membrane protein n=1 Tax=Pedobacter metabolipauper TaxID=425513 RepID=A0A4V3D1G8_9SPHI|nr:SusC/RagA family TonB-linked outer membrane protein [Pedobacter metabolipauper]TDQ11153.1 TonB-linked SusC/RagA family outer membrane protein [Pedobacter metabolipauper]